MQLPKFILTLDGHLRIGMCYLHSELLQPGDRCIGGGFYDIDYLSDVLILNRKSHDYGEPRWHLIDKLYVPREYAGFRIKYVYADGYNEDFNVSDLLDIEYY